MSGIKNDGTMRINYLFTIFAGLAALAACAKETAIPDNGQGKVKMTLNTVVTKAAFDDVSASSWTFGFETSDQLSVRNSTVSNLRTFTRQDDGSFTSEDATPTANKATWYAVYPKYDSSISLLNQAGTPESAAALYVLTGIQANVPGGATSLSITLNPRMSVLKIVNNLGNISISIKVDGDSNFLTGLTPVYSSEISFNKTTSSNYLSARLLNTAVKGTYYVCVPAGRPIGIYNNGTLIKSSSSGLTAGKYYTVNVDNPNLIPGLFSISSTKQVRFTKGNLYRDSKSSWKIEANQLAYPASWDENHVGHLYFCDIEDKPSNTYAATYSSSGRTMSDDLFYRAQRSINGDYGYYYNPSRSEWDYLLCSRPNHDNLYKADVTVEGVDGCVIIANDDFAGTIASSYASEAEVTAAGLLCLPPAGTRQGTAISAGLNYYWTSTPGSDIANACSFNFPLGTYTVSQLSRSYGCPVRLVLEQ
ncbi:MAG: hypothetical protein IKZ71_04130 [Bacteroidales bacterium]|nr:hypothetical protein [Bacteroidales bacterium]